MRSEEKDKLAITAYQDAGREIDQSYSYMASNMAVAVGLLATILVVLGAGELFAGKEAGTTKDPGRIPQLSAVSLIVLSIATPILLRFFVRSMLAFQNIVRFGTIHRSSWRYLAREEDWALFLLRYDTYVIRRRSPRSVRQLVWSNLKYGFLWPFAILATVIVWGFISTAGIAGRIVAASILLITLASEFALLQSARPRHFNFCDDRDLQIRACMSSSEGRPRLLRRGLAQLLRRRG